MFSPRNSNPVTLIARSGERVLFRSTLEARWSIYFDLLALSWVYEPLRFDIGGGITYTPDFNVAEIGYIEIKPTRRLLNPSLPRIKKFIEKTGERVYAFCADDVAPNVWILAESPIRIIELDRLASKIVLAGRPKWDAFMSDPLQAGIAIETAIKSANRAKIKGGEPKTFKERQTVAVWKREPIGAI